jgi:hypothetical protein
VELDVAVLDVAGSVGAFGVRTVRGPVLWRTLRGGGPPAARSNGVYVALSTPHTWRAGYRLIR